MIAPLQQLCVSQSSCHLCPFYYRLNHRCCPDQLANRDVWQPCFCFLGYGTIFLVSVLVSDLTWFGLLVDLMLTEQIQISLAASSLETNLGCSSTTQETKRQSQQWTTPNSSLPKKAHMPKSKIKTMLITFFDQKGLIHHEFVPQNQTVNQRFYQQVLSLPQQLGSPLQTSSLERQVLDAAPWQCTCTHCAQRVAAVGLQASRSARPPFLLAGPCSVCNFWLFPKLKSVVKWMSFCICKWHQGSYDKRAEMPRGRGLCQLLLSMARTND